MAYRGPAFYPRTTQTDVPPAATFDLADTASPPTLTTASMSGVTGAATVKQLIPAATTTMSSATAASTALANDKGWQIPVTTGVAATSTNQRVIPNGASITFTARCVCTGALGNNTQTFSLYKRASGGALTFVQSATFSAPNSAIGTTTDGTASLTLAADLVLAAGETMYVEAYHTIASQTVTAGSATVSFQATPWTLNSPNGLAWRYLRSQVVAGAGAVTVVRSVGKVLAVVGTGTARLGSRAISRAILVVGTGTAVTTKRMFRSALVTGVGSTLAQLGLSQTVLSRMGGAADYPVTTPTKHVAGRVLNGDGTVYTAGATVLLVRDSDNAVVQTQTSAADGSYSFVRDAADPNTYHVEARETSTSPAQQGSTPSGLAPA